MFRRKSQAIQAGRLSLTDLLAAARLEVQRPKYANNGWLLCLNLDTDPKALDVVVEYFHETSDLVV